MFDLPGTYLERLAGIASAPVYLVGGTIRDLLSGTRHIKDIDFLMPSGSEHAARQFADAIGGRFFFLDEERRITRVVKHEPDGVVQFDFTNFEGPDLRADLARRDFTVNAMAIGLEAFLSQGTLSGLIDPFNGSEDVRERLIRVADPGVLDDDPLRLLRAARFAATLGFSIETGTVEHIRSRADLVTKPSAERIRDELFQILDQPGAGRNLLLLDSLGLLMKLLPELVPLKDFAPGKHHCYDILTHSLKTADYTDAVVGDLPFLTPEHAAAVSDHLKEPLEPFVSRHAALRFACLLHDNAKAETCTRDDGGGIHFFGHDVIGADKAEEVWRRFRLSRETTAVVARLIRHHMRPLNLAGPSGPSKRALYRYCRDVKDAVPESIVLSLADAKATEEAMPAEGFTDTRQLSRQLLEYYYGRFLKSEAKPFVTGQDLIARGMKPGPNFRLVLEEIRELQAAGTLRDRSEALEHLDRSR